MAVLNAIKIVQNAKEGENFLLLKALLKIIAEVKSLHTQE